MSRIAVFRPKDADYPNPVNPMMDKTPVSGMKDQLLHQRKPGAASRPSGFSSVLMKPYEDGRR